MNDDLRQRLQRELKEMGSLDSKPINELTNNEVLERFRYIMERHSRHNMSPNLCLAPESVYLNLAARGLVEGHIEEDYSFAGNFEGLSMYGMRMSDGGLILPKRFGAYPIIADKMQEFLTRGSSGAKAPIFLARSILGQIIPFSSGIRDLGVGINCMAQA